MIIQERHVMKRSKLVIYFLACTIIVLGLWFYHNRNKFTFAQQVFLPRQQPHNFQCNVPKQTTTVSNKNNIISNSSNEQEKATSKQTKNDWIKIAGQKFTVLFEAPNVSIEMRKTIIADIELNFSHCTTVTVRSVTHNNLNQKKYIASVSHVLDIAPKGAGMIPDMLETFGGAHQNGGHYQVVISESLSKAYEKAQQFKDTHNVMFQKLNEFIAQLKDKEFISKIEHGPKGIAKQYELFEDDPGQGYDYEREIVAFLKQVEIRKPSILDFLSTKRGRTNVILCTTVITFANNEIIRGWPQFIYLEDQWKLFLPKLP